jgi:hypothetical protein
VTLAAHLVVYSVSALISYPEGARNLPIRASNKKFELKRRMERADFRKANVGGGGGGGDIEINLLPLRCPIRIETFATRKMITKNRSAWVSIVQL